MSTNDHTVPQSYLRRFARHRRNQGSLIVAQPVDDPDAAFQTNVRNIAAQHGFYWATALGGAEHHEMEHLLGRIEAAAMPAFSHMLDHRLYALHGDWPMRPELRERLAWWIAAQLLRTTRQRHRLGHNLTGLPGLEPQGAIASALGRDVHVAYIGIELGHLARVLVNRPWALGFSDTCLITGDVPVAIINNHDAIDQVAAAAVYDVYLPLDPHRFLFMPSTPKQKEDRRKRVDHRVHLPGGLGVVMSRLTSDVADRHTFRHPDHEPPRTLGDASPRAPRAWEGDDPSLGPAMYLEYGTFPGEQAIERRWLTEHPTPRDEGRGPADGLDRQWKRSRDWPAACAPWRQGEAPRRVRT